MRMRRSATAGLLAGLLAMGLAASSASGAATARHASGTLTVAEQPSAAPDSIFPYLSCANFSVSNTVQFQQLMYRPLYWFGLGSSPAVQYPLSLARAPVFSSGDTTVTVSLKGWKFSDGQVVNAESVAFFLNLYRADPASYCGYAAGFGIPDELSSVSYPGGLAGSTVVLHFDRTVGPKWILGNYLSEITPFPEAWDKTSLAASDGSAGCATAAYGSATATTSCIAAEHFLAAQSADTTTYTNALWGVVDGPWRLSAFDAAGDATFAPNPAYGGPQHPLLAKIVERAYTTSTAEENGLFTHLLQVGYVDPSVLPGSAPAPGKEGKNVKQLAGRYVLEAGSPWSFNYAPFSFNATSPATRAVVAQLYVRQALQLAINQPQIVKQIYKNYAWPTVSPLPPNTPSSVAGKVPNPYPFSPPRARSLMAAHGWKLNKRLGALACVRPGSSASQCGKGIARNYALQLQFAAPNGSPALDVTLATETVDWNAVGIRVQVSGCGSFHCGFLCPASYAALCMWGGGWIYAPDIYPTGEELLTPAGSFDVGGYDNSTMTALITATTRSSTKLTAYANFAAMQLPVLYEPNPIAAIEVARSLKCASAGACAPSPLEDFMPEYFHY